jgi:putative ABC transport system permease protein
MTAATYPAPIVNPLPPSTARRRLSIRDLVAMGWQGLGLRPLRSGLTALGIAIGIAAVVAVLGISEASRANLLASLDQLGTNLLTASAGQTFGGGDASLPATAPGMTERIGPVEEVTGTRLVSATVRRTDLVPDTQTGGISVLATQPDLADTLGLELQEGTFLNSATSQFPATVLGSTAARRLGITSLETPVLVWIGNSWFSVVGIMESNALAPEVDRAALIGMDVAAELFDTPETYDTLYVRTNPHAIDDVRSVLAATVSPANPEEVRVDRPSDALEARAAAETAFTALLVGLGALALLVAGVGIANVMLMSVLERRTEIGLRRALGATRRHIAGQFLTEALALAALGGVVGAVVGGGLAAAYAMSQGWPVVISLAGIGLGLLAALAIGAGAGLYPALRAARVTPTEALRSA